MENANTKSEKTRKQRRVSSRLCRNVRLCIVFYLNTIAGLINKKSAEEQNAKKKKPYKYIEYIDGVLFDFVQIS